jgi:RNA polymerase sigma-B factor
MTASISSATPLTSSPSHHDNDALLRAYCAAPSLRRRNALVQANLPLVRKLAREEAQRSGACWDDLLQVGSIGLIKAVERYRPERGAALSSVAVPYVRGAMRQYLRDRCQPLQGGRNLRELRRRGEVLQLKRRQQGLPALAEAELVVALDCPLQRWRDAEALALALKPISLDQPSGGGQGPERPSLVELVADPSSTDSYGELMRQQLRQRIAGRLQELESQQRWLLEGRLLQGRSWRDLGEELGLSGKVARRRCDQLLEQLRQQLQPERDMLPL